MTHKKAFSTLSAAAGFATATLATMTAALATPPDPCRTAACHAGAFLDLGSFMRFLFSLS
ncbi:MAG: hypothetical protein WAN59_10680 [Candidatus Baltobacteraceae bacterium]